MTSRSEMKCCVCGATGPVLIEMYNGDEFLGVHCEPCELNLMCFIAADPAMVPSLEEAVAGLVQFLVYRDQRPHRGTLTEDALAKLVPELAEQLQTARSQGGH